MRWSKGRMRRGRFGGDEEVEEPESDDDADIGEER